MAAAYLFRGVQNHPFVGDQTFHLWESPDLATL